MLNHASALRFGAFVFVAGNHFGYSHAGGAPLMNRTVAQGS